MGARACCPCADVNAPRASWPQIRGRAQGAPVAVTVSPPLGRIHHASHARDALPARGGTFSRYGKDPASSRRITLKAEYETQFHFLGGSGRLRSGHWRCMRCCPPFGGGLPLHGCPCRLCLFHGIPGPSGQAGQARLAREGRSIRGGHGQARAAGADQLLADVPIGLT